MKMLKSLLIWTACIALSGCLVPEKFDASLTVKADGSSLYRYDGTAIFGLAAAAIKEKGSLSSKEEKN